MNCVFSRVLVIVSVSGLWVVSGAQVAHAEAIASDRGQARDPYFQLSQPKVELVEQTDGVWDEELEQKYSSVTGNPKSLTGSTPGDWVGSVNDASVILDQIIAMGKKIWDIVEAGKPVVNIQTDRASALPQGSKSWAQYENWSNPASSVYKITYNNGYGMNVVTFSFRVVYTYGGQLNGKGRFLANVTVIPKDTTVAWGYTFNASTQIPEVVNVGTKVNPVAGMELDVNWVVKTAVKESRSSAAYFIRGDGTIVGLNN